VQLRRWAGVGTPLGHRPAILDRSRSYWSSGVPRKRCI
jgi:hypothetical protein